MKIQIEALVTRFKGVIQEVQPLRDMYTEVSVDFTPGTPEYEYMKKHRSEFLGDRWSKEAHFLPAMEANARYNASGEAKDVAFTVGELEVTRETMTVDWKKD